MTNEYLALLSFRIRACRAEAAATVAAPGWSAAFVVRSACDLGSLCGYHATVHAVYCEQGWGADL